MSINKKEINTILARNIRALRKSAGYTQKELAEKLDCSDSYISAYECGEKTVTRKHLEAIANHFGVTVDSLLNSVLSPVRIDLIPGTLKERIEHIKQEFPMVSTKEAMANADFKRAYESINTLYDNWKNNEMPMDKTLNNTYDGFEKASHESIIEADINTIAFFFLLWSIYYPDIDDNDPEIIKIAYPKNKKPIPYSDFMSLRDKLSKNNYESRNQFKLEIADDLFNGFEKVYNSIYKDIIDYYLALGYIYNILDTDLTDIQAQDFGLNLMNSYARMKNKYARQYFYRHKNRKTF